MTSCGIIRTEGADVYAHQRFAAAGEKRGQGTDAAAQFEPESVKAVSARQVADMNLNNAAAAQRRYAHLSAEAAVSALAGQVSLSFHTAFHKMHLRFSL